jgi:hypothetical protein
MARLACALSCALSDTDIVDTLLNSKLKVEKFDDDDTVALADSGDVEDVEDEEGDVGDEGPRAVFRRRRDARGGSGRKREYCIVSSDEELFVRVNKECCVLRSR